MKTLSKVPFGSVTEFQPENQLTILKGLKVLLEQQELFYSFSFQLKDDLMSMRNVLLRDLKGFLIQSLLYPSEVPLRAIASFSVGFENLSRVIFDMSRGNHTVLSSILYEISLEFDTWFANVYEGLEAQS
jgi:hypothetical protein